MMGRRQKLIDGGEFDVVYSKGIYCYLSRAGVRRKIKRKMNKRERREAKLKLRETPL